MMPEIHRLGPGQSISATTTIVAHESTMCPVCRVVRAYGMQMPVLNDTPKPEFGAPRLERVR